MNPSSLHGLLVLDKPGGMTSREVVNRIQRWLPRGTRVGHTGTLDPLATGVLVLCLGAATRLVEYVQRMGKTYRAGVRLGARSDTDDADGTILPVAGATAPDPERLQQALAEFIGDIDQVPPAFSAAHVAGRRAYDLARQGEEVALEARWVRVHGIQVLRYAFPLLEVEIHCGKGTYIRSLARDLGERLGCGALVETLRRTAVGSFRADDALSLDADPVLARSRLLLLSAALGELPRLLISAAEAIRLRQGQSIPLQGRSVPEGESEAAAFDPTGAVVGVVRADPVGQRLFPAKVLPPSIV